MARIMRLLQELEQQLEVGDGAAPAVSQWSVFQQIEHVLIVNQSIAELVQQQQTPAEVKPRNFLGVLVLSLGFIPRGKGQAPKQVVPSGRTTAELQELAATVRERYEAVEEVPNSGKKVVGNHPYFGGLTALQWQRFAEVHSAHHLKIIRDIRRAEGR